MSHILIRVGIGMAVAAGTALFVWLVERNQRNQINSRWRSPPTGSYQGQESQCPVCLQKLSTYRIFKTPCGHLFHWECAKLLFTQAENKCPECRTVISLTCLREQNVIL